jgi:D-alanine-D-alanine ligase
VRDDVAVFLVANLKERSDYTSELDRSTEYFDEAELNEITNAIRANGFYAGVFIGEDDFIRWIQGGGTRHFHKRHMLVYSTAQSGAGPGRKSLIPSFCALHGLDTLGSDAYVVSLARHKPHVNAILRANDIPCPDTWTYGTDGLWLGNREPPAGVHVLLKSCYESASIGITKASAFVTGDRMVEKLRDAARNLQQPAVLQRFVRGREFEVPLIIDAVPVALTPVGISLSGDAILGERFLDFDAVASDAYGFYDTQDSTLSTKLRGHAETVGRLLGMRGFGRVDFRVDDHGNPFITDVSTSPHLVAHSSFGYRIRQDGFDLSSLMAVLVGNRIQSAPAA